MSAAASANAANCLRPARSNSAPAMHRFRMATMVAIWKESRKRSNTMLATIPPRPEPTASSM